VIVEVNAAVRLLLASIPYYDGQVPNEPSFPYRVLRMGAGNETAERLCGTSGRADFRFYITSVGLSATAVEIVADAARSLLIDVRPVVAGRVCTPIRRESSIPIQEDRDVTAPGNNAHPMFGVDTYSFTSRKD